MQACGAGVARACGPFVDQEEVVFPCIRPCQHAPPPCPSPPPFRTQAPCPSCGTENTTYFGDILTVAGGLRCRGGGAVSISLWVGSHEERGVAQQGAL